MYINPATEKLAKKYPAKMGEVNPSQKMRSIKKWIETYLSGKGVVLSNRNAVLYPEVTGYWIETALSLGYTARAEKWYQWLLSIQNADGGWSGPGVHGGSLFFDSGQVIRGLATYARYTRQKIGNVEKKYLRYFDAHKEENLIPKNFDQHTINWYLINLQVAWIVRRRWPSHISLTWLEKTLKPYLKVWEVGHQASHFDIYVLEALHELGIGKTRLHHYLKYFDKKVADLGYVPCDRTHDAPCYTATAQLGVLYYKMGKKKKGALLFERMLAELSVHRGNWPGSGKGGNYMQHHEISWGLKYFLDLLQYYIKGK